MNIGDVNNVVLFNQYLDVLRSLSESNNAKDRRAAHNPPLADIRICTARSRRRW